MSSGRPSGNSFAKSPMAKRYTPLEWENALYDVKVWAERDCEPPLLQPEVLKWRHWRPGRLKELEPTTQRAYEVHLRQRWADRLLAHFTPYAGEIPNVTGLLGNRFHQEALDLLGDARFRTIRQHCLMYELLKKKDFTAIPWRESDVRRLLNRLRDEKSPLIRSSRSGTQSDGSPRSSASWTPKNAYA